MADETDQSEDRREPPVAAKAGDSERSPREESWGIDADAQETVDLLRMPTTLELNVAPRVDRLIERLGRLGAMLPASQSSDSASQQAIAQQAPSEPTLFMSAGGNAASKSDANPATDGAPFPEVPDFRILGILGHGGMGTVYLAEETALARRVALKLIRPGIAEEIGPHARFLREARAMAAVVHDHVMPVYRVGECPAGLFFTMPLLDGETLAERLKRVDGPLPPAETLAILRQTAAGLAAIHAAGLVHRDIKPSNLWLQRAANADSPRVRVLDLGVVLQDVAPDGGSRETTHTATILGTPGFMAPEQAAGRAVDARADLFALGAIGYRLSTGQPAFSGETLFALLTQLALHDPPPARSLNPDVPESISRLLEQLLQKEPNDRPPSAGAVLAALDAEPRAPSRGGNHVRLIASALFGAVVVAAIVITVINSRGERAQVTVPDRSAVEINSAGDVRVTLPADKAKNAKPPDGGAQFEPLDETWKKRFASLAPEDQRSEIAVELRRRNPEYRHTPYRNEGLVNPDLFTNIGVFTDDIRDITPLSAVRSLTHVQLISSAWMGNEKKGQLASIEPLRGLKLEFLDVKFNGELRDLAPLEGMRLNWLNLTGTGIRDLEALRKVDLTGGLLIGQTAVSDLRPIADKPLWELRFDQTAVKDLAPIAKLHLEVVALSKDSAPWSALADMPLKHLHFTPDGKQDVNIFRKMTTLETINDKPVADFWREYDRAAK